MPSASPADVRAAIGKRATAPVYLLLGDDDGEISRLASDLTATVEDELRVFNVERMYGSDKTTTASSIAEACRQMPMMGDRRVVVVVRAERLLKPKRGGGKDKPVDPDDDAEVEPPSALDPLADYVKNPVAATTLVLATSDIDKVRKAGKAILQHATVVECWGLKTEKNPRYLDLRAAARLAELLVRKAVAEEGRQIDPAAARLVAERAGADIVRLRGDIDRLMLYTAGKAKITLADVQDVVSAESSNDDWAVTTAIQNGRSEE